MQGSCSRKFQTKKVKVKETEKNEEAKRET